MNELETLVAVRATLNTIYHLLMFIVVMQVLAFVLSLGKLWMMNNVREELARSTSESAQYRTLTQQYYDLYTREGRDAQQVILNAAKIVKDTVKASGPLSDTGSHPAVPMTPEQRAKAEERIKRRPADPMDTP